MAKNDILILRMERAMKEKLRQAGDRTGETMTTFALKALSDRADKVLARPRGALPTYFRALVERASKGGDSGWMSVGRQFARGCVSDLALETEDVEEEVARLNTLARRTRPTDDDRTAILEWFDRLFPRCMELVPARRRSAFATGVIKRATEEGIET